MKTTTVSKTELLEKLNANRVKHIQDYKDARAKWEEAVIKRLAAVGREARNDDFSRVQYPISDLPKPEHFTESYDTAIEQLKWEQNDSVVLEDDEFANYVQDNWTWRNRFIANTSSYLG